LVLPILGLLVEQPRHQYGVLSELRLRYPFLHAKTSTVYTLVRSLVGHGLVTLDNTPEGSTTPPQAALTPAGVAELRQRVERHLLDTDPSVDPRFMIALAYLGILTPRQAIDVLRERAAELRSNREALTESLNRPDIQELHMIEVHFVASRLEHDATWLTRLAQRIENSELNWPGDHQPAQV
ncbi:MAG: PadR family transcriptional regulator, partial [Nocardioidaceae bacterium]